MAHTPSTTSSVRRTPHSDIFEVVETLTNSLNVLRRYRVSRPMMVLAFRKDHQTAVTLQVGEIFALIGPAQDDRFAVIEVRGEQFLVFESDLKDRGTLVLTRHVNAARIG